MKEYIDKTMDLIDKKQYFEAFLRVLIPLAIVWFAYYLLKLILHITFGFFLPLLFIFILLILLTT